MDQDDAQGAAVSAANELHRQRRFREAAARLRPFAGPGMRLSTAVALGKALLELGEVEDAERWFGLVARNTPDDARAFRRLADAYGELGRLPEAEAAYRRSLALAPDDPVTRGAFGQFLLSVGRWLEGWPLLEGRAALAPGLVPPVSVAYPRWRGEDLAGRSILVWPEQGFGDQILLARFAAALKARGAARVTLGCHPALARLFATLSGADEIVPVPIGGSVRVARHDYWIRSFSLPELLGVTPANAASAPYLSAPQAGRARPRGGVGLVWRPSPTGHAAGHKTLPDDLARRLLARGLVSLHPEDTGAEDFADTAAIVDGLDLVISVDTSTAHLAGAMGRPVWTLLPSVRCDWRWLRDRADTPWYPSMRLYRAGRASGWEGVTAKLEADLDRLRPAAGC